jgi:plasmid stability protein
MLAICVVSGSVQRSRNAWSERVCNRGERESFGCPNECEGAAVNGSAPVAMHPSHFCASRRNRAAAATKRADNLTQAILAKAFRGERVPTKAELARREGRTYEPAFELLARIRSARENSTPSATFPKRRITTH